MLWQRKLHQSLETKNLFFSSFMFIWKTSHTSSVLCFYHTFTSTWIQPLASLLSTLLIRFNFLLCFLSAHVTHSFCFLPHLSPSFCGTLCELFHLQLILCRQWHVPCLHVCQPVTYWLFRDDEQVVVPVRTYWPHCSCVLAVGNGNWLDWKESMF